jgi:phage tail sheath gpL-like
MNRIFIAAAAAAIAFSGAANAEGIAVKVAGKTTQAIHRDIRAAAQRVCDEELTGVFDSYFMKDTCVTATVAKAEAQLTAPMTTASAATQGRDASATVR